MVNHPARKSSSKNYVYELICTDHAGWSGESLWGDYSERTDRLFATAREAHAARRECESAPWEGSDPSFAVVRRAVHEWLWSDDEDEIEHVLDLTGRTKIERDTMPVTVARFLLGIYGDAAAAWSRESAWLAGASSATHTAAFAAGINQARCAEIREIMQRRGITI